jgi:ABC transport system ATP-binding/permease protein
MNYLSAEGLSKQYGEKILFSNVNLGISKGDKVALVADNGSGKSTLLNILCRKDSPDSGKVSLRDGVRIGFLMQEPNFTLHHTIKQVIESAHSQVLTAIQEYHQAVHLNSEKNDEASMRRFELAATQMDQLDAWDYERKMNAILSKFGIHNHELTVDSLSGGQKKRLALALVLLDNPDLLMLDEPTNHLDIDMIEWLEEYLLQTSVTVLMVTHDRYFLDRICNQIIELSDNKLYKHEGNYAFYLEKKSAREEVQSIEAQKAKQLLKKELEWMRRMPKARGTKSKARIEAFYETKEKANKVQNQQELKLQVKMSRIGGNILELDKIAKSFGSTTILNEFSYTFKKGERIGIVGKNGVGKTSFLQMITNQLAPDSGTIKSGDTIVFGYYTQKGINLNEDKRVIDVVKDIADIIYLGDGSTITASQFLNHFLFPPTVQYTFVSALSGGEKRRLYLLTILVKNPNFLILDEPTNDLDLPTLTKLEEFLMQFKGCLIVVTHDRYFMDKLVDHLFIMKGDGNILDFNGSYNEYREQEEEEYNSKATQENEKLHSIKTEKVISSAAISATKLTYNEKKELEQLETTLKQLEQHKQQITEQLNNGSANHTQLTELAQQFHNVESQLAEKEMRWLELSERNN